MKNRIGAILLLVSIAGISIFALTRGSPEGTNPPLAEWTEKPVTAINTSTTNLCAYVWVYKDLPEIKAEFQAAVRAILPGAEAHATAFGEDCVSDDGSATFSAMETDFYVIVPVSNLNDNQALGDIAAQLLPILDDFPLSKVSGPKEGFLEITFRAGADQRVFRVPLPRGRELSEQGLRGAKLLEAIESP